MLLTHRINFLYLLSLLIFATRVSSSKLETRKFMQNPLIYGAIAHAIGNSTLTTSDPHLQDDLCTLSLDTQKPIWKYLNYTGKSPNDLGFYQDCRDMANPPSPPSYTRVGLMARDKLPIFLGVCFPKQCKPQIVALLNQVAPYIEQTTKVQLKDEMIDNFDSDTSIRPYTILMIFIGCFFLLLGIIGIIIEYTPIGDLKFQRDYGYNQASTLLSENANRSDAPSKLNQSDQTQTLPPNSSLKNGDGQQDNALRIDQSGDEIRVAPDISKIDIIQKKQKWAALLLSFSLTYNLKKLVNRQRPRSNTDVLDGVRVLSIFWVILGHSYFFMFVYGMRNSAEFSTKYAHQFLFTTILQGPFSVDVFFFMSAFLGGYVFLKKYPKNKRFINPLQVLIAYFHRYYRLTPLLAFTLYFSAFVIYPMTSGPGKMLVYNGNIENCKANGWRQILYVENFVGSAGSQCFGWGWYLSNDMQMFLILPWIIILYKSLPLLGTLVLAGCFLGNFIATGIISYDNKLSAGTFTQAPNFQDVYYVKPWIRVTPYLVGLGFAMMYENFRDVEDYTKKVDQFHKKHGKNVPIQQIQDLQKIRLVRKGFGFYVFDAAKKSAVVAWIFVLLGFAITFFLVYIVFDINNGNTWSRSSNTVYLIFNRGLFVTGLALVLIPLMVGRLSMLASFLSCQMFAVMAKITYSVYLIHQALLCVFFGSAKSLPYATHLQAFVVFFSFMILSYIIGGFFSLLVDFPLTSIDKVFIFPDKKKIKENYEKLRQHALFTGNQKKILN